MKPATLLLIVLTLSGLLLTDVYQASVISHQQQLIREMAQSPGCLNTPPALIPAVPQLSEN